MPLALRKKDDNIVLCPYCFNIHTHKETGHVNAQCDTPIIVVIGGRSFHSNYGFTILEYEQKDGSYWLNPNPQMPCVDLDITKDN